MTITAFDHKQLKGVILCFGCVCHTVTIGGVLMKLYGLDLETHDPHLTDKGVSWVYGEGKIIVTGIHNKQTGEKTSLDGNGGKTVKKLLLDKNTALVGANIVYDLGWLCYEHGLAAKDVTCSLIDVSMAEQCVDEYQQYSLDALAWKYLKERKGDEPLKAVCEKLGYRGDFRKHLQKLWDSGYRKEIRDYVISDADQPVRIWQEQKKILEETGCMEAALTNFKLVKIVLGMKQRGVRVDMKKRTKNYHALKTIQDRLQAEFEEKYGKVNFNSPKQLAELFDRQRVPYRCKLRIKGWEPASRKFMASDCFAGSELWDQRKRLKEIFNGVRVQKGQLVLYVPKQYSGRTVADLQNMGYATTCNPSIDKHALAKAKKTHPVAGTIVDLKQVTSIIDKFIGPKFDRFIVRHGEDNYRIHADFNIVGARQTGRFSSANPNLHQVPSKTVLFEKTDKEVKLYKLCRETIIPDEGWMGKMDYSGQENRLMAHFAVGSGAEEIRRKYNANPELDFHKYIGEISGLYEEYGAEVGRKYAKNCSFGLGYGMQLQTMTETFGWSKEEAERITALYHDGAPFVKATMDKVSEVIVKRGFIRSLAGRHEHLQTFNGKVDTRSSYKGFNKLIQGSAADMMKKALIMLDERGLLDYFPLYLTVHDEIDFGVPDKPEAFLRLAEMQDVMEHTFPLSVPMRVDPDAGPDWGHMIDYKKHRAKFLKVKNCTGCKCLCADEDTGKTFCGSKEYGCRKLKVKEKAV
jgi:DNA polymerase I-like protein with 3'-5' exonuclease and polymerase domains